MVGRVPEPERIAAGPVARARHRRRVARVLARGRVRCHRRAHRLRVRPRGGALRSGRRGAAARRNARARLSSRGRRQRPSALHRDAGGSRENRTGAFMKVIVVGGGIAGLAAAHRVVERSRETGRVVDLTIYDAADRMGGTIRTEHRDGFLVECGPDSFLSEKPWALDLCRRLGIEDRLVRTDDRFRRTFVVFGGRLHPLPDGFQLLAPTRLGPFLASTLFSWPGKLRMALDLALPRGSDPDESLGAFVRRRLGREALERVAQPLVAGIYTADPDDLALAATMPRFLELERRERSVILAMWRAARRAPAEASGSSGARWSLFVTFKDGMEELIRLLGSRLPPGAMRLKERVAEVRPRGAGWQVVTRDGSATDADAVILAPEAHQTARIIRPLDPALAHLLEGIPYASSATVTFGYRRGDIAHALDGFGFVVPRVEGRPI